MTGGLFVSLTLPRIKRRFSSSWSRKAEKAWRRDHQPEDQVMVKQHPLYAVLAEFENTEDLIAAVRRVREAGYEKIDAFTPFPVEGLADAVGFSASRVPVITFIGGALRWCGGLFLPSYPDWVGC